MLKTVMQDVVFGLRMLRKNPGFTIVAVLTLALGIGVNTTVFTLVNAVLFKGLPYEDSGPVVMITSNNLAKNQPQIGIAHPDFLDMKSQSKSFKGLAAAQLTSQSISDADVPAALYQCARVSSNTFSLLGQKPFMGRDFLPEDDEGVGKQVAILGFDLWKTRYGGDPNILGRHIEVTEQDFTVIGVMPAGVKFPLNQDFWIPLVAPNRASSLLRRDVTCCFAYGRLVDGVGLADVQAEMNVIAKRLEDQYPASNKGRGIAVMPYTNFFTGPQVRALFLAMLGAVGFVLLIACANVANLLLARSMTRAREVSVRAALGASRGRIVRQLLIESLLLSILGGVAGYLISVGGIRAFRAALPPGIPYWLDFSMDYSVFTYLASICIATGLLFGLTPALHMTKVDLSGTLKEGTRGSGGTHARLLSRGLVVTELALALVLLVAAGLMIRSFMKLQAMSSAFQNDKVLTTGLPMTGAAYITPEPRIALLDRVQTELQTISGAKIAMSSALPLSGAFGWQFELEGKPITDAKDRPTATGLEITPEYFEVLGIPLLKGRTFDANEGREGRSAVIVNQLFANRYWPGEDVIGKRIRMVRDAGDLRSAALEQPLVTIVGVVPDVRQNWDPNAPQEPVMYVPYRQGQSSRAMFILARTFGGDPHSLMPVLQNAMRKVNNGVPLFEPVTLPEYFARNRWFQRVFGIIFAIFGGIGLFLALVGIYGVLAYSVSQRTQEIGIRIALGGQQASILKLVVGHAVKLAVLGVVIGLAASYGVTRVMRSVLIGVSPTDTMTFIAVGVTLTTVAVLASYIPARRASRLNPVEALRTE
jgi:putative ABC transport system permease protein